MKMARLTRLLHLWDFFLFGGDLESSCVCLKTYLGSIIELLQC